VQKMTTPPRGKRSKREKLKKQNEKSGKPRGDPVRKRGEEQGGQVPPRKSAENRSSHLGGKKGKKCRKMQPSRKETRRNNKGGKRRIRDMCPKTKRKWGGEKEGKKL